MLPGDLTDYSAISLVFQLLHLSRVLKTFRLDYCPRSHQRNLKM